MEFKRHKIEVDFCSTGHLWVPHFQIRGKQDFVPKNRVSQFMLAYLNNESIPPPEVFLDERRQVYIIDEGHTRATALYLLYLSGVTEVGQGKHFQSIVGGFFVKEIIISEYTKPYQNIYFLDKITPIQL